VQNQTQACPGPFLLLLAPHSGDVPRLVYLQEQAKEGSPGCPEPTPPPSILLIVFDSTVRNLAKEVTPRGYVSISLVLYKQGIVLWTVHGTVT